MLIMLNEVLWIRRYCIDTFDHVNLIYERGIADAVLKGYAERIQCFYTRQ